MKNLFLLVATLLALSFASHNIAPVNAQRVNELKPTAANDTLTNADTAWVYLSSGQGSNTSAQVESDAISVQGQLVRLSGTAAGSVTLEGSIDGSNWNVIDTDNFTNVATQIFVYDMRGSTGNLMYKQYRLVFITSGTVSAIPKTHLLRRSK